MTPKNQMISLMIPKAMVSATDERARSDGRSRSSYVRRALESALTADQRMAALDQVAATNIARARKP